jgi:hypothetical protein
MIQHREITVQTKVNLIIDNNLENTQVQANMRTVYNLLGDDTQDEAKYSLDIAVAA